MRSSAGFRTVALLANAVDALSLPEISVRALGRRLSRRDDSANNVTIPAAISIAPSQYWDGNDGPWSSFPLQLGGGTVQTQNVRVMPSTASYNTWVIDPLGCPQYYYPNCANSRGFLYDHNQSVTYVPVSEFGTEVEENLGLDTSGYAGYEDITLGWQGSGGPKVDHAPLFDIADSKYWIGIFGLNPLPTNFTNLNAPQPSFMESLSSNNTIPSTAYAYTAGNQYRFNKVYGSLTLGGYDQNRFKPTNVTFGFYEDISRDLLVNLKSITTDKNIASTSNLLPGGQISIYLDSTVPSIWLPENACSAFESAFGLTWNSTVQRYIVNGTAHSRLTNLNPTVSFTLANNTGSTVTIDLPYAAFDLNVSWPIVDNGTTEYYFPLMRAANDTQYTLGRAFFQEAYLIADYDRGNFTVAPCSWDQTAVQNTAIEPILSPNWTTIAERQRSSDNGSSGFPAGAIAGVVVGIIVVIAILGLILYFIRRKKNRTKRQRLAELEAKNPDAAKNSHDSSGEGKPFISAPMGGELGGDGEIHELTAPHKAYAQEMDSPHKLDPNKVGYSEMEGAGYFGPGKGGAHEMPGQGAIYEMPGSDVQELSAGRDGFGQSQGMHGQGYDVKGGPGQQDFLR